MTGDERERRDGRALVPELIADPLAKREAFFGRVSVSAIPAICCRLRRPSAASRSATQDSTVATDPSIGLTIRMPGRWPFAAWRAFAHCCFGAFGLAGRRLLAVWLPLWFLARVCWPPPRWLPAQTGRVRSAHWPCAATVMCRLRRTSAPASRFRQLVLKPALQPVLAVRHRASRRGHPARPVSRSP